LERPRGQHSVLPGRMLAASCFSRISIRFRGYALLTQPRNQRALPAVNEPGEERFALPRIFRLVRAASGISSLEVRALDMTAAKRVNTTPQLRTSAKAVAGAEASV
jgi:hypothetical protein